MAFNNISKSNNGNSRCSWPSIFSPPSELCSMYPTKWRMEWRIKEFTNLEFSPFQRLDHFIIYKIKLGQSITPFYYYVIKERVEVLLTNTYGDTSTMICYIPFLFCCFFLFLSTYKVRIRLKRTIPIIDIVIDIETTMTSFFFFLELLFRLEEASWHRWKEIKKENQEIK